MSKKIQAKQIDIANLVSVLDESLATKEHTHSQSDITNLTQDLAAKAPINNPTFTGKVTLPAVDSETNKTAATVGYVDSRINTLLGGENLDTTLDTIKEIQDAVKGNKTAVDAIKNTTYDLLGTSSGTNGNVSISLVSSEHTSSNPDEDMIKITGSGNISVTSDASGNIIVNGTDTTYSDFSGTTHGLVPSGSNNDEKVFLSGTGQWVDVKGTQLSVATSSTWSGSSAPYTQTLTVEGITGNDVPTIGPILTGTLATDNEILNSWNNVYRITTGDNSITIYSYTPFTNNFNLNIYVASKLDIATTSTNSSATLTTNWIEATASSTPSTTYCKYYQTIAIPGVTAITNAVMNIASIATEEQRIAAMKAEMFVYSQSTDSVTVAIPSSGTLPTVEIPVQVVMVS